MPIGKPDAIPKKIWQKKKDHEKINIRIFINTKITKRVYHEYKITYRKAITIKNTGIISPESLRLPREF